MLGSAVGGTAEKALAGLPYVKFSEAAGDKHKHPQVPTVGKYEAVVGHKEVSRYGVTQQLQLLNSQSSITSQYAPTYDYIQRDNEYASTGYYCVPPAVSPCIHIPLMHSSSVCLTDNEMCVVTVMYYKCTFIHICMYIHVEVHVVHCIHNMNYA